MARGSGAVVRLRGIEEEGEHNKGRAGVRQCPGEWQRNPLREENTAATVKPPPGQTPIRLYIQHQD